LGLRFDRTDYESAIWKEGKEIITQGLKKKVFQCDAAGAVIADLEKQKLPNKILLRSDGTSIYITTDLYLAAKRHQEEKFNELIYVVGSEQDLYFKQLFAIFKLLGVPYADKTRHLSYGMVFLPEGKMKSRQGTVVDADELILRLQEYAAAEIKTRHDFLEKNEVAKRARVIALAALKFYLLAVNPSSSMHYNPQESLSFTGKTGPYLLYTLARMKSILRKASKEKRKKPNGKEPGKFLKEPEEWGLILTMEKVSEVIDRAAETVDPEELATYLYNLAKNFSDFYEKHPVLKAEPAISFARLQLVKACAKVLEKGLNLLGIATLEEM
jgi:arginyl-tRNA synthetase